MLVPVTLLVASLCSFGMGKPLAVRRMQVHEARATVPSGFTSNGPAPADTSLSLRLNLKSNNMDGLISSLLDVSTPTSANYGNHLTKEQAESFVAPSSDTVDAVTQWLKSNDVTYSNLSPAGDWLNITVPVSKANSLLDAEFSVYTHQATGTQLVRTLTYSIPSTLSGHLELVHPTTDFAVANFKVPTTKGVSSQAKGSSQTGSKQQAGSGSASGSAATPAGAAPASCATSITPTCLQELYDIPPTPAPNNGSGSTLFVSGFIDQFANQADLQSFLTQFRTDISPDTTFALQTLDGGSNDQNPADAGTEANLDIQYATGLATGIPITFVSVGDDNQDGINGFLDIINSLLAEDTAPAVLTTSYGFNEDAVSAPIATTLCNAYAQLGARGTSVIFSSGDGGVSGSQDGLCKEFLPTFPSSCPYVTSVGATQGVSPETAASFSSGGFSNLFARPSYQDDAVTGYLTQLGNTNAGLFNSTGRGFPDVAYSGVDFNIVVDGQTTTVDGTSCSAPSFASSISLINANLLAGGGKVLGFLNPLLYSSSSASIFNDITSGSNPGCFTQGFPAETGWDPVTGLGSTNFATFNSLVN